MPRADGTRRNIRTIERIKKLLDESEERQLTTQQIYLRFVERWVSGAPTMARLGNLLAKSKEFELLGQVMGSGVNGEYSYKVGMWGLNDEAAFGN